MIVAVHSSGPLWPNAPHGTPGFAHASVPTPLSGKARISACRGLSEDRQISLRFVVLGTAGSQSSTFGIKSKAPLYSQDRRDPRCGLFREWLTTKGYGSWIVPLGALPALRNLQLVNQGFPINLIRMTKNALHARLSYLRNAEAVLALALPGALAWHWWRSGATVDWSLRLPSTVLVGLMLLQGALYWHLKLVSMRSREPLPSYFRPLFHGFRTADLIALIVITIWLAVMTVCGAAKADLAWAAAILAFAVLEFVNYFGLQLMHDTVADFNYLRRHRRLRRAALATDLGRRQPGI